VNWQQVLSLLIVAVAAAALIWGRFRRKKFRFGHDTHCGCSTPDSAARKSSIVFHMRKGERRQILMKME